MAKAPDTKNYEEIDRPYDTFLNREASFGPAVSSNSSDPLSENEATNTNHTTTTSGNFTIAGTGNSPTTDAVEGAGVIKSGSALSNLWIVDWIKSRSWQPKSQGFMLDALKGYIECMDIYIKGTITAIAGFIGGFEIGSTYIRDIANTFGLSSNATVDDDVRFWAGDTYANRTIAPFKVTESGLMQARDVSITGGSISTDVLQGIVALSNVDIAAQGWTQSCVFSSTDASTVSWLAGQFVAANGNAYQIDAGDTGVMTAKTYIYLDLNVSSTAYQTTTEPALAVGTSKALIATAENSDTEANFRVIAGHGGQKINAGDIEASSITANEIAAGTITANKLATSLLYAGEITLDANGHIKGGQTAYDTGTGFFLGDAGTLYKFSIGTSSGDKLTWDGSKLTIIGSLALSSALTMKNYAFADLPVAPTSEGPQSPSAFI